MYHIFCYCYCLFIYLYCIPAGSNSGVGFHHWTRSISMLLWLAVMMWLVALSTSSAMTFYPARPRNSQLHDSESSSWLGRSSFSLTIFRSKIYTCSKNKKQRQRNVRGQRWNGVFITVLWLLNFTSTYRASKICIYYVHDLLAITPYLYLVQMRRETE